MPRYTPPPRRARARAEGRAGNNAARPPFGVANARPERKGDGGGGRRGRRSMAGYSLIFALAFGAVAGKLYALQTARHDESVDDVAGRMTSTEIIPARRGRIVDAVGRALAMSVGARSCAVDPTYILEHKHADPEEVFDALHAVLGFTDEERARLRENARPFRQAKQADGSVATVPSRFAWVRRKLPNAVADALEKAMRDAKSEAARLRSLARDKEREAARLVDAADAAFLREEAKALRASADRVGAQFAGVVMTREYDRVYPQGRLASHLVGFVDAYGAGREGLERFGDEYLRGVSVKRPVLRDARRRPLADEIPELPGECHGLDLELSIDSVIQLIAREELALGIARAGTSPEISGCAIVMDPHTGDVLAMVSLPDFDPNDPAGGTDRQVLDPQTGRMVNANSRNRRNDAVSTVQEPGSVMKPFVYARALERGLLDLDEVLDCSTYRMSNGRTIKDIHPYGPMTAEMALVKSSNPGAVKVGERLGLEGLHELVRELGFGAKATTVYGDAGPNPRAMLSGESRGEVHPFEKWNLYSLGSVPMGYEFSVTPLQMAVAYCALANGGWIPEPRILRAVRKEDGGVAQQIPVRMRRRVFRGDTTRRIREALRKVVTHGTGRMANDKTYAIAGKSGTAEMPLNAAEKAAGLKGHSKTRHVANFVGMAPYESPRLVVSVTIRETTKMGGAISGPVSAAILRRALEYLHHPPSANASNRVARR